MTPKPSHLPPLSEYPTFPELFLEISSRNAAYCPATIIDGDAKQTLHGVFPRRDLTWNQIVCDVHSQALKLQLLSGRRPRSLDEEPLAVGVIGRSGYSLFLLIVATMMLRWTPLIISSKSSPAAVSHLLKTGEAPLLIMDQETDVFGDAANEQGFQSVRVESCEGQSDVSPEEAREALRKLADLERSPLPDEHSRPAYYLHTSGSTGHPKLVPWTHRTMVAWIYAEPTLRPSSIGRTMYTTLPLSHVAGNCFLWVTMFGLHGQFVFLETRQPITASLVLGTLQDKSISSGDACFPPSILEDLHDGANRDTAVELLGNFKMVMYVGAPLRIHVGSYFSGKGVRILPALGMTETGPISIHAHHPLQEPEDWQYHIFVTTYQMNLIPVRDADKSLKELVIVPGSIAPNILNRSNPDCFATNDLFQQHPDPAKHMLWRHMGRKDDLIVLSNGLKANSRQISSLLCESPLIHSALVFGSGRFQVGSIILPPDDQDSESESYKDAVWHHVEQAVNPIIPRYARIVRPLLLFADASKAFLRTDKNTVRTQATLAQYADVIEEAYSAFGSGDADAAALLPPGSGLRAGGRALISQYITAVAAAALGRSLTEDEDFFLAGGDSMMAIRIAASLSAALRRSGVSARLPDTIVYTSPTITALIQAVEDVLGRDLPQTGLSSSQLSAADLVEQTLNRHRQALSASLTSSVAPAATTDGSALHSTFAVTGTTGSFGAFLVSQLLGTPSVNRIYLLHRTHPGISAQELHERAFAEKGLDFAPLRQAVDDGRAIFVQVEISQDCLGADSQIYAKMASELTHIIHAAWTVNFNLALESFDHHLAGIQRIVELALASPHQLLPRVLFISSVAATGSRPYGPVERVPERPLESAGKCGTMGYAQSKYIAEKLLEEACSHQPRLSVAIVRSGQLSGSLSGHWARSESIPILMRASVQLRKVPKDLADVHWLPLNIAAEATVRLSIHTAFARSSSNPEFYHLEASRPTSWSRIAEAISGVSKSQKTATEAVSGQEWLESVANTSGQDSAAQRLLPYFRVMIEQKITWQVLDTTRLAPLVGGLLDFEVDDDLLGLYVLHACG